MMTMGPPPGSGKGETSLPAIAEGNKTLWYFDGGTLAVRLVRVGAGNGTSTEVIGADDREGRQIIVKATAE
jgi:hypothetical protein